MSTGYIVVEVYPNDKNLKIKSGKLTIFKSKDGTVVYKEILNEKFPGKTEPIIVETPSKELSQHPLPPGVLPYEPYDITLSINGFIDTIIKGVQAFPSVIAIQPIVVYPLPSGVKQGSITNIIVIPPPQLLTRDY